MAGGVGSRFWPMSRKSMPKQFLDMFGDGKSLLRHTFERFSKMISVENFLVVTNQAYREFVKEHIPEIKQEQILCEPVGRNTAPCICYAAFSLMRRDPEAEMIITPTDHYINREDDFLAAIEECACFSSQRGALLTLGIRPTHPETGYGYIQISDHAPISKVKCFTEKPSFEAAQMFLQHKEFFWNSGIFISKAADMIEAIKTHLPDYYSLFHAIENDLGTPNERGAISRVYAECKAMSIDYGVMERADNVYVRCGDYGWSDVGTWGGLYQYLPKDSRGNATSSDTYIFDTNDCMISLPKDKVAVVSGLDDFIVVDTDDVLMICPKNEEQNIRKFIDEVKYNKGDKFL